MSLATRTRWIVLAILVAAASHGGAQGTAGRYLYFLGCDGQVQKFDTAAGKKIATYDLATRPGARSLVPAVKTHLDGCIANQAIYLPGASIFYTVVPAQAESKPDGTKDYRVLGLTVPALRLVKTLPAGDNLDSPPHLELAAGTGVKAVPMSSWSPPTDLDLSPFAPDKRPMPNQILEASGERVLLRLFTANKDEVVLAVANRSLKTLVRLQQLPSTTALNVHLAPGGAYLLVEEVAHAGSTAPKTGKAALYDSTTGLQVGQIADPHLQALYLLAISPTGKAVYRSDATIWFIDLGRKFSLAPVTSPLAKPFPSVFFANR